MKYPHLMTQLSRRATATAPVSKTVLTVLMFGVFLLAACGESSREDWPRLTVLASPSLKAFIEPHSE